MLELAALLHVATALRLAGDDDVVDELELQEQDEAQPVRDDAEDDGACW